VPIQSLTNIAADSRVVIDANIFVYAANRTSSECANFLERCAREEVRGVTTFEALAEVTHRLMLEDALATGIISEGILAAYGDRASPFQTSSSTGALLRRSST